MRVLIYVPSHTHHPGHPFAAVVAPPYGMRGRPRRDPRLEREAVVEPKRVPERPIHHAVRLLLLPFPRMRMLTALRRITTTIIAPTPLIAANFIILGQIIRRIGQKYSRVSARWCKHSLILVERGGIGES